MDSVGETSGLGVSFKLGFKEEEDSDRLRRVRERFVNGILSHAHELEDSEMASRRDHVLDMKSLESEISSIHGQCSVMGQGRRQKPLIVGQNLIPCRALWFCLLLQTENSETPLAAVFLAEAEIAGK